MALTLLLKRQVSSRLRFRFFYFVKSGPLTVRFFRGFLETKKVAEKLESGVLAFLGVKLGREEVSLFDRGAE
jgi:hypothetical protein